VFDGHEACHRGAVTEKANQGSAGSQNVTELALLSLFLPLTGPVVALFAAASVQLVGAIAAASVPDNLVLIAAASGFIVGLLGGVRGAHLWFPPSRSFSRSYLGSAACAGLAAFFLSARAVRHLVIDSNGPTPPSVIDIAGEALALLLAYGSMWAATLVALHYRRKDPA
jgi:hypothetical protein